AQHQQPLVDVGHVDQSVPDDRIAPGHGGRRAQRRIACVCLHATRAQLDQRHRVGGLRDVEDLHSAAVPADQGQVRRERRVVAGPGPGGGARAHGGIVLGDGQGGGGGGGGGG